MAVSLKGFRKLVVDGKVFYWRPDTGAVADSDRKFLGYLDYWEVEQLPRSADSVGDRVMPVQAVEAIRRGMILTKQELDQARYG